MEEYKILIADDEEQIVDLMKEILGEYIPSCNFETFENGFEISKRLEQIILDGKTKKVNLIILDNGMPIMNRIRLNGEDIMKKYAKQEKFRKTPFILYTGNKDPELHKRALNAGAYKVIEKPVDITYLVEICKSALAFSKA